VPDGVGYRAKSKGEVVLFYSILCPHCYRHEPELVAWQKQHPTIRLDRRPITLAQGKSVEFALAAQHLDNVDKTGDARKKLFDAIHKTHRVRDVLSLKAWMQKNGFGQKWETDRALAKRVSDNYALAKKLQLSGVPALMVNGEHVITSGVSTFALTRVLNHLLAQPASAR
jgi:thiol:disulfide interchange protein DsbA